MHYQDRVVCFLDFLGFRSQIAQTVDARGADVQEEIDRIATAIAALRKMTDLDDPQARPGAEVTQFSDSVVISFNATDESGVFYILLSLLHTQMSLAHHGILCRGAVARGKLIHTGSTLFGPAMNRAYELETKAAIYPRVILDDGIVSAGVAAPARHHLPAREGTEIQELLAKDCDGFLYVDYITRGQGELDDAEYGYPDYLNRLRSIAASGVDGADKSVAMKYRWLAEKLNPHLERVKKGAGRSGVDPELVAAYESLSLVPLPVP